ncbi:MAG: hypothetical protein ABSD85_17930 [Acidimicrobiales bacterium]|jgi:hypothetical protein
MTRDYERHGIADLFAARKVAAPEVLCNTRRSYKATDVLAFLKLIDLRVPLHLKVHVLLHNLSAHKITPIAPCLAHRGDARWYQHFTRAPSSWRDVLQRQPSLLIERRRPRAVFTSVDDLFTAINTWSDHWNADPNSVPWRNPADELAPS